MEITQTKVKWAVQIYNRVVETATTYFKIWESYTPDIVELVQVTNTYFTCKFIVQSDYGSDMNDREYELMIPIEYLWMTDDWEAIEEDKKIQKTMEAIKAREKAHELKIAAQEQKDRQLYFQLKNRFETDPTTNQLLIEEYGKLYIQQLSAAMSQPIGR